MAGIIFCEATELYNLLNQCTKYSRLTEPIYLYLVDVRTKSQYDESHVITAKRAKMELDAFEPYPAEILPAKLYMGAFKQASDRQIQKNLKIKAYLNLCREKEIIIAEESFTPILHVPSSEETNLLAHFPMMCEFLDEQLDKGAVLVFSTLGISRCCTTVMAYLMYSQKITLKDAWALVQKCKATIRPHRDFVWQLSKWEKSVLEQMITNVSDPYY